MPPPDESEESRALVERVVGDTALGSYCDPHGRLPVHVHSSSGEPVLTIEAIHLFPDGFDDVTVDVSDPDCGNDHFIACVGDFRCRTLSTGNWLAVGGTLACQVLEGCSGCNRCTIATCIEAELILERGHSFESDEIRASVVYTEHDMIENPDDGSIGALSGEAEDLFDPKFFHDGDVDLDAVSTAVVSGESWRLNQA